MLCSLKKETTHERTKNKSSNKKNSEITRKRQELTSEIQLPTNRIVLPWSTYKESRARRDRLGIQL